MLSALEGSMQAIMSCMVFLQNRRRLKLASRAHMMLQVMSARQARSLRPAVGARLTFWWGNISALGFVIAMQVLTITTLTFCSV